MFIDTHAHMDHPEFNKDRQQLLKEIKAAEYDGKLMLDGEYDWGEPVGKVPY